MPWKTFETDGEYCVYKLDGDGNKTGDSLGCHASKEEADDQVAALNANTDEEMEMDDERARGLFDTFWTGLKGLFIQKKAAKERALSMSDIYMSVYEQAEEKYPMAYLSDLYTEDDGAMFAILANDGKLYRSPVRIEGGQVMLDEWEQVAVQFTPVQTRTVIKRQADGRYRWVSRSATSTLNRAGEIDSRALFQSFVAHIEATGEYPIRQFFHQGEQFRTGQADFVAADGNVLITSGLYDETELARREVAAITKDPAYWGESISYKPTELPEMVEVARGIKIPVFSAGVLREISTLSERMAANLFTAIQVTEVNRMLKGKAREDFVKLFDGDEAAADAWLEENVDELNRSIQESGLITRTQEETPAETPAPVEPAEVVLDDAAIGAIAARLLEGDAMAPVVARAVGHETITSLIATVTEMARTIEDLNSRLALLEQDDEAKRQRYQEDLPARANGKVKVTYRPREVHAATAGGDTPMNQRAAANRPKSAY